ncbi:MAG TPA: hypothetical protein VF292_07395 [Rhodanobacteraceae bacterium]
MTQRAVAFSVLTPGFDEAERPDRLVLPITDDLRQRILDAQTLAKQYEFDEIKVQGWFYTPKYVDDDDLDAVLQEEDVCVVDASPLAADDVVEQRVDCMGVVIVDGDMLRLTCYDHYGDYAIESPTVDIDLVLGAVL